ncbi:AIPR family protein [Massilia sp. P8910]|uniref:AIPR family protein n=1 Tax=Massilia antarctica TaxID=2765360 RepID=UPI001E32CF86|nr:AIPR family protein [Massilia antarctica]MCE3606564.1 AIPR family protein [Massilia antarctica]
MNINASIVDQRLTGIVNDHANLLPAGLDLTRQRSVAFVLLCMSTMLDIPLQEAAELITEGGQDQGVDGLHLGEVEDGEFTVTIFQAKYKHKDLSGAPNFPENGVEKAIVTVSALFDPARKLLMNEQLAPIVEEIRSLIRDGYIPLVRVVLCNNGASWVVSAQQRIDQTGFPTHQVLWSHFNHDSIVGVLQRRRSVDDSLKLDGKAVIEEFNYRRVLIGKVPVSEIAELFNRHDDLLLERNIRRYLGLHANRVNSDIQGTLTDPTRRGEFYFYNNGITMICRKFRHNALQGENYQLKIEGMQIINGGQTCKTIQQTLNQPDLFAEFQDVYVLLRLYELADDDQDFVREITYSTNSQNPVDLRDLRSNDEIQRQLEIAMTNLGYSYKRQREDGGAGSTVITANIAAEAVLAVWRRMPQQAKFRRKEHFGKLYEIIFNQIHAAQIILAVLIFRLVENERKRPDDANPPDFLPYASHYIAMLIGDAVLAENFISFADIDHRNFATLAAFLQVNENRLYRQSLVKVQDGLNKLYGIREISLQQLSATFRRGDLLEFLN